MMMIIIIIVAVIITIIIIYIVFNAIWQICYLHYIYIYIYILYILHTYIYVYIYIYIYIYIYLYICWIRNWIQFKNHRKNEKYVTRKNSIPASNHFNTEGLNFNTDTKFILIEQFNQTNLDKLTLQKWLKFTESFWILRLKTLHAKDLDRELNKT